MYWTLSDSFTLIGRSVRHSARSVDALLTAVMLPVMILLLFVYVFGGSIQTGGDYVDYVVPETMPGALQAIASHQPITPITETVRALLMGGPGGDAVVALAWCAGGIVVGSVAAAALFRSRTAGRP
jgi:hypothetical protein